MKLVSTILLLLCASAFGQAFTPRRPFVHAAASSSTGPDSISGLAYWWVASDLTNSFTNGSPVNVWTDRVSGKAFSGTTNLPILEGSNHLRFFKTNWLQLFPAIPFNPASYTGIFTNPAACIIASHNQYANGGYFLDTTNASQVVYAVTTPSTIRWNGVIVGNVASNHVYDFIACISTNTGTTNVHCFTNGVFMALQGAANATSIKITGSDYQFTSTLGLIGDIYEIQIWTNRGRYWYDSEINLMHRYATNTYGYTP